MAGGEPPTHEEMGRYEAMYEQYKGPKPSSESPSIKVSLDLPAVMSEVEKVFGPLISAAESVISHWDEFGPEHGFEEKVELMRRATKTGKANHVGAD